MEDHTQCLTKIGFRKTYQTNRLIEQKCHEWRIKMWTATVDFTKAFRLHLSQVNLGGTRILQRRSRVRRLSEEKLQRPEGFSTDRRRERNFRHPKRFQARRSDVSLLFNTVLQYSLKDEIQRWQKQKGMGIYLSDQERDCLTNLRFADDVFATSKEQMRNMMCEFKKATEKVGLRIHPDKMKILSKQSTINSNTKKPIEVGDEHL